MNVTREDVKAIEALDFSQIKAKLMHTQAGKGWPRERVDAAEREYRRFLYLVKKYPDELAAPSQEVDEFWHQHILDTAKYARDCEAVFGYFLHHNPYLGLGAERDDDALRQRAGKRMRDLYEQTFGEAHPGTAMAPDTKPAWCMMQEPIATGNDTAWCTVTRPAAPSAGTAWCTFTTEATRASPAEPVSAAASETTPRQQGNEPAWCTFDAPTRARAAEPAWCTVTAAAMLAQAAEPAWCTVTRDIGLAQAPKEQRQRGETFRSGQVERVH